MVPDSPMTIVGTAIMANLRIPAAVSIRFMTLLGFLGI
jgi:hypothetical protein